MKQMKSKLLNCLLTTSIVLFALTSTRAEYDTAENFVRRRCYFAVASRFAGNHPYSRTAAADHLSRAKFCDDARCDVRCCQFYRRELHALSDGCPGNKKRFARGRRGASRARCLSGIVSNPSRRFRDGASQFARGNRRKSDAARYQSRRNCRSATVGGSCQRRLERNADSLSFAAGSRKLAVDTTYLCSRRLYALSSGYSVCHYLQ